MTERQVVLGVDAGTTSTKVVGYDTDGRELVSRARDNTLLEPASGEAVQNPLQVIESMVAATRDAISAQVGVVALALSSAMHSLVGLGVDQQPVTHLLTWADNRAAPQAARLRAEHPTLHARTGTPPHQMAPLPKLMWFRECAPETFAAVRRWVGIKELLVHRLTGEWLIDVSCASGTGLMSLAREDWDDEALAVAGVHRDQLSRIVPSSEILKLETDELGLPRGTPIVIGAGDGPLANLGIGAVKPGVAACSIGTSGALRLMVKEPSVDRAGRLFCYALVPGRWAIGGAINNGGVVLRWAMGALAPELAPGSEQQLLETAAGVAPGSDGLIMLPYLFSERAPYWDAAASGAYVGLRHFHGRGHLVRAAIEGVCQQLALVLESMRAAGNEVREVRATGGFARSALWRQLLTDVLGLPVAFAHGHEGSAFGAALLGMEALGMVDSIDRALDLVKVEQTLEPDPAAAATYAEQLPLFARLHDDLAPVFAALSPEAGPPADAV